MAQDLELDDDFLDESGLDESQMEEIPEIPQPKKPATRKKTKGAKVAPVKEFDIRAAHQAWKEKNGIEDDYYW